MSTASAYLIVAGINVDVVYKDIKNLHIGVYPPSAGYGSRRRSDSTMTSAPGARPAAALDQSSSGTGSSAPSVSRNGRWSPASRTTSGAAATG